MSAKKPALASRATYSPFRDGFTPTPERRGCKPIDEWHKTQKRIYEGYPTVGKRTPPWLACIDYKLKCRFSVSTSPKSAVVKKRVYAPTPNKEMRKYTSSLHGWGLTNTLSCKRCNPSCSNRCRNPSLSPLCFSEISKITTRHTPSHFFLFSSFRSRYISPNARSLPFSVIAIAYTPSPLGFREMNFLRLKTCLVREKSSSERNTLLLLLLSNNTNIFGATSAIVNTPPTARSPSTIFPTTFPPAFSFSKRPFRRSAFWIAFHSFSNRCSKNVSCSCNLRDNAPP